MNKIVVSLLFGWVYFPVAMAQERVTVTWNSTASDVSPPSLSQLVGVESTLFESLERWLGWQEAQAVPCESSDPSLKASVALWGGGVLVALWNSSEQKVAVTLQAPMQPGIYTTELVKFTASAQILTIERRNGLTLLRGGQVQQTHWLAAQSGLIVRFVERLRPLEEVLRVLRRSVWQGNASRGARSRLASLMRETDSHWYQARASLRRGSVTMSLRNVHRMLFLVSGLRVVASKYAETATASLYAEQVIDALSELSSALLNCVVRVSPSGKHLDVQVANGGSQVWRVLRLSVEPALDAIVIANLRPMERAEATLSIETGTWPRVQLSILYNGGYARLRVSPIAEEELR